MTHGRPVLITGGAGFIGSNLADRLATDGHSVLIYDALQRPGVERNLAWLQQRHSRAITPIIADVCDTAELGRAVSEAGAVFHLAAQVAVTTSLAAPGADFMTNVVGTLGVLEAIRRQRRTLPLIFASTNKVYGDLADLTLRIEDDAYQPVRSDIRQHGIGEERRLDFHTPYGCSKGAADQYVLDYARSFGLPTAVFRMSCIYGPRQRGTEDQGWVAHFMLRVMAGQSVSLFGDGCQARDILHVDDVVEAYLAALARIDRVRGMAFNLGGGPSNAVSLRQVIREIESLTGRSAELRYGAWRAGDQRYYVSDCRRAREYLGLSEPRPWREGLRTLAEWLLAEHAQMEPLS